MRFWLLKLGWLVGTPNIETYSLKSFFHYPMQDMVHTKFKFLSNEVINLFLCEYALFISYLIGQNFGGQNYDGQNISTDKIFDTMPKFRQFCPIFTWLLYWNIGQNFRRTKCFVGQNFRHQAEISTLLSDEFLSDKVSFVSAKVYSSITQKSEKNWC